ncbi:MAG: putative addiction module component (TIGR02574 family) [Gammaproteobacteria bacterium]|jgi:putative addiction module component (TIGR02574 family)
MKVTAMTEAAKKIFHDAMNLPSIERASLIEELLSSMDKPDFELDKLWAKEAEDRLAAYRRGEIESFPANEIFAELGRT